MESLRTHLIAKVSDPRTNRDATNSPFIIIGITNYTKIQYPIIQITETDGGSVTETAAGQKLDASNDAVNVNSIIQIMIIAGEDKIFGNKSNDELLRNLGSQITDAFAKKANKAILSSTYDIKTAEQIGGGQITGPDDNAQREIRLPYRFNIQFLYKF